MVRLSETARERELYRYYQPPDPAHHHDRENGATSAPSQQHSSTDIAITAFAQLGALRLNAARCIISLVGRKNEYVLAEASRTLSLQDDHIHKEGDQLWYGSGTLRARSQIGTLMIDLMAGESVSYISVNDLQQDDRFKSVELVIKSPFVRSLVCLPLRTALGHVIGLYCMFDDRPRSDPSEEELQFLKDMAVTTMNHIESGRVRQRHDRAERMVKALALFLEGGESLKGWWLNQAIEGQSIQKFEINERSRRGVTLEQQADSVLGVQDGPDTFSPPLMTDFQAPCNPVLGSSKPSGSLNLLDKLQELAERKSGSTSVAETTAPSKDLSRHKSLSTASETSASETQATTATNGGPTSSPSTGPLFFDPETGDLSGKELQDALLSTDVKSAFSRASNLIREAVQLDGVAFFDASIGSFGAGSTGNVMNPRAPGAHTFSCNMDTGSSGSDRHSSSDYEGHSQLSPDSPASVLAFSTRSRSSLKSHADSEKLGPFSEQLLRVLAKRYPHGKIFNFDEDGSISSSDSESRAGASSSAEPAGKSSLEDGNGKSQISPEIRSRKAKRILSRHAEAAAILKVIPGARSVAWFPLWDSASERWYAGTLIWSSNPLRVLTPGDELIYLAAWGNSIMAEVSRLSALVAARMKVDFVSSISHELRSPLHGILASVEFLQEEENMPPMQVDMINTIHSCGKTLLDTIDHVLEFAKVTKQKKSKRSRRRTRKQSDDGPREQASFHKEEMLDLCRTTEEVIDSVYAGRNRTKPSNDSSFLQMAVVVVLDISWQPDWNFKINVGAFRRVLMNLFSNALKYTDAGFVKVAVTLDHEQSQQEGKSHPTLSLTVTDSGKGISREFLRDHLYTAFKQDDALSVGTGLGLSIVRRVLRDIDGNVNIESELGSGTKASVSIPLKSGKRHSSDSRLADIVGEVREMLKGRQVCIVNEGFDIYPSVSDTATGILSLEAESLMLLKSSLTSVLTDWLNVEVSLISELSLESGNVILAMASHDIADKIRSLDANITMAGHSPIVIVLCAATYRGLDFTAEKGTRVLYLRLPVFPNRVARILHDALRKQPSASTNVSNGEYASTITQKSSEPPAQGVLSILKKPSPHPKLGSRKSSRIQLPERPAIPTEGSNETVKHVTSPISTLAPNTYNVLLVEDNAINLKLLNMHMTKLHQSHASATNGREAVDAYKASPADIVFMDLQMPVMDGLEASRMIRRYENEKGLAPTAIVALTGAASLSARQEAFSSGVDLFLTKPVAMKLLKGVLLEFRDKGRGALREFD